MQHLVDVVAVMCGTVRRGLDKYSNRRCVMCAYSRRKRQYHNKVVPVVTRRRCDEAHMYSTKTLIGEPNRILCLLVDCTPEEGSDCSKNF